MQALKRMAVFVLSLLLRGAALFVALALCIMMMNNVKQLAPKIMNNSKYAELKNYASISISPNIDTSTAGLHVLDEKITDFFKATNEKSGWLFALESQMEIYTDYNFKLLSKDDLLLTDYAISVNNNYLSKNPAYDLNGNAVIADENALEFMLLVPEKYKSHEAELISYYTEELTALYYYADDIKKLGEEKASTETHAKLPLKLIYIKNGQKFFMYDTQYRRHLQEYIENPIIKIVTAGNLLQSQVPNYLTTKKYMVDVTDGAQQLNNALKSTGLQKFVLQVTGGYDAFQSLIIKTIVTVVVQLCLVSAIMAAVVLISRTVYKKHGKKQLWQLPVSWVLAIAPLLLWGYPSIGVLLLSVVFLFMIDIFCLRENFFY